jgi:hypothetical protein
MSTNFKVTTTAVNAEDEPISKPVTYTANGTLFFTLTKGVGEPDYYAVKATGQNLLFVPRKDGSGFSDLFYVTGNANFSLRLDRQTERTSFTGEARKVNICDALK